VSDISRYQLNSGSSNSQARAFGATAYTAGITEVIMRFNVSMTSAILGLSLFLFGIVFAPIMTPHLSEAFGRSIVYLISLPLFSLFILGAGLAQNFATLAVCRFFAGFFGGPCLVLIEGTFADVWAANATVTYYSFLSLASFLGAASGRSSSSTMFFVLSR
jgi:MFS family permease